MIDIPSWLPALILLSEYGGNWELYLEAIYEVFKKDFIEFKPQVFKMRIGIKRHPIEKGKEAGFWHLISEGRVEGERTPDLRRCERIRWPRPMIEAVNSGRIKHWKNTSRGDTRIVIALEDFSYIVVLSERKGYFLLWTAYCVERDHRRKKLEREYAEFCGIQKS